MHVVQLKHSRGLYIINGGTDQYFAKEKKRLSEMRGKHIDNQLIDATERNCLMQNKGRSDNGAPG